MGTLVCYVHMIFSYSVLNRSMRPLEPTVQCITSSAKYCLPFFLGMTRTYQKLDQIKGAENLDLSKKKNDSILPKLS